MSMQVFKKVFVVFFQIVFISTAVAQDKNLATDKSENLRTTRQGFGSARGMDMSLGFVNGEMRTEGSAYYFSDWDTNATLFVKDKGKVRIQYVNVNLFDNTLEALYEGNKVFTFDSNNLLKIIINDKVFRTFTLDDELKIYELLFNGKPAIYKYYDISYSEGSVNPMLNRNRNKYIKNEKYFLYKDGALTRMKMTKKSASKLLQTDKVKQEDILNFIKQNRLSLKKEADFIKVLEFVNR